MIRLEEALVSGLAREFGSHVTGALMPSMLRAGEDVCVRACELLRAGKQAQLRSKMTDP